MSESRAHQWTLNAPVGKGRKETRGKDQRNSGLGGTDGRNGEVASKVARELKRKQIFIVTVGST